MCGIVGWVDLARDLGSEEAVLDRMTRTMHRRGPDDGGRWVSRHALVGHRRLAVIDPAGGAQPMTAGDVVLSYSGEVYNHDELREELRARGHAFRTRSDTEVVLRACAEWGAAAPQRLNGMFAFAVWDDTRRELLLVRDRLGVKPLYYHAYPGGLVFASEPKGILANPSYRPAVDEDSIPMLFNARLTPAGETPLRGLRELRAGHILRFGPDGLTESRYWGLENREHTDDAPATVRAVRDLLSDVVRRQIVSDVPISALLSGGLDSSAITALAVRARAGAPPLRTFSVDFSGSADDFRPTALRPERDAPYAALAAEHLGCEHSEVVVDADDLLGDLPATRRARDLPGLGQFDASMYRLFARAREAATVALTGEAADELFGGYPWFHRPEALRTGTFPWLGDTPRLTDCLAPDVAARVLAGEQERDLYLSLLAEVPARPGETGRAARVRQALFLSLQGPLRLLLDRKDRMSMALGLEVRVPFCDHRLVEYVWNVPWSIQTADGREKSLLRAAVADLLPAAVLDRPKSAYPASFTPGYERSVLDGVRRILRDPDSPLGPALCPRRVDEHVRRSTVSLTHAGVAHQLIPIVEVDAWMRAYGLTFR